jgi:DNA-binding NtrC family response regulator
MRVSLTKKDYLKIKEGYGGDLDSLKITLTIEELRNVVEFISLMKDVDIDKDLVFKSALEEVYTTKRKKELEKKQKEEIIPLDTIRSNLEILALHKNNGNISQACKDLGISVRTLYRDIKQYSIDISKFKLNNKRVD